MRQISTLCVALILGVGVAHAADGPARPASPAETAGESAAINRPVATPWKSSEVVRPDFHKLELKRDAFVLQAPGAEAEVAYTSNLPVGTRGRKVPVETVRVSKGRVDVVLPQGNVERGVLLQGPSQVLAISTSGRFAMAVGNDTVTVAALEGQVLVGKAGRFRPLSAGELQRFDKNTGAELHKGPLPAAPRLSRAPGMAPNIGGPNALDVQVAADHPVRAALFDRDGNQVGTELQAPAGQPLSVSLPGQGSFRLVARAVDESGIGGPLSRPLEMSVLGVEPGPHIKARGVYLLAPGQRLRMVGVAGLEMRYGAAGPFVPAAESVGLPTEEATLVQFRDPQAPGQVATLRLAPRIAEAKVSMGPGTAVWPRDPVHMAIRIQDGNGQTVVIDDKFTIRTRVNLEDVEVDWRPTGSGVEATLQPRSGPGPWVVRVIVEDEHGREVGRGHLEVIRERRDVQSFASR